MHKLIVGGKLRGAAFITLLGCFEGKYGDAEGRREGAEGGATLGLSRGVLERVDHDEAVLKDIVGKSVCALMA